VITLTDNDLRVKNANRIIEDNPKLKLQKIPAITMDKVDPEKDRAPSSQIKEAEIACAKSHIEAIKKVASADNKQRDALWFIFEDDVQLKQNFLDQVTDNIRNLNRPWDVLNAWLMPPRHPAKGAGSFFSKHWIIPDGYWGMQGYVLTPDSAARVLKCLDPPSHQVWAQVDEMIGCCAAASNTEPFTRCVYQTSIPANIEVDMHVYCMTPPLLVHLDRTLGSYAHKRKKPKPPFWRSPNNPLLMSSAKSTDNDFKISSVRNLEDQLREMENKMTNH